MPRGKKIENTVEAFVEDLDADIDSQVRELSIEQYGVWLREFRAAVLSVIDARIEAQREDAGS